MGWFILKHIFSTILSIIDITRLSNQEKDLEILILRQQLSILQRKHYSPIKPNHVEKVTLAVLTARLKRITHQSANQLQDVIRIFQPETILRWHRDLVYRKWTYPHKNKEGRPSISKELEELILRLARENTRWGYGKIQGELVKLSFKVSQSTVRKILERHGIHPVPVRNGSIGWRHLLTHYKEQILACDFFTIETIRLQTIYVLFFIELGTRRIYFAGCTEKPDTLWITQQARQLIWVLDDSSQTFRFLIHDNDTKFSSQFDNVFFSENINVIHTAFQAPQANSFAERWVRSVREECLDHILIINQNHLRRVLKEYINYYNHHRPHQGIDQQFPISGPRHNRNGPIHSRNILGGIIHDYYRHPFSSILTEVSDVVFTPYRTMYLFESFCKKSLKRASLLAQEKDAEFYAKHNQHCEV
jgi:transposase InsO family protein